MERKTLLALKEETWIELWPGTGVEVKLIPANMPDFTTARILGTFNQRLIEDACTNAFVDFRGYVDEGKPVPNTLENRIEFYSYPAVRTAMNQRLESMNSEALVGEEPAANG